MDQTACTLQSLPRGTEVAVQDPGAGGKPGRWSKTGTIVECLRYDSYLVRIHGSRSVSKRNRIYLRKILPMAPEQYIIPVDNNKTADIPDHTKTEITEKFVAVQPPRKFTRLSPDQHRKVPAAPPGQDVVTALRRGETAQGGVQSIVKDVWDEMCSWKSQVSQT